MVVTWGGLLVCLCYVSLACFHPTSAIFAKLSPGDAHISGAPFHEHETVEIRFSTCWIFSFVLLLLLC